MTLILLTVVCGASLIAVLAIFLFALGVLLDQVAENLDDCLENVKRIVQQAEVIIPGIERINQTCKIVAGTLPLLYGNAERIAVKMAPLVAGQVIRRTNVPPSGRRRSRR